MKANTAVSRDKVLAWRMERHYLTERLPAERWQDPVSRICNLHAQVMSSAELSLSARVDGLDQAHVKNELWTNRGLVKTWAIRGTLHLLLASEFAFWTAAARTRKHFLSGAWQRASGISPAELTQINEAVAIALDGKQLSRDELADEVARILQSEKYGQKLRGSWGSILKPAAFQGYICFAPSEGQNVRFTRPDSWIGPQETFDPDEAMLDVVRRYLTAYGPADRDDFGRWWGLQPAPAGKLLKSLESDLTAVDVEETPALILTSDLDGLLQTQQSGAVRLLPAFDPYVIGVLSKLDRLLPGPYSAKISRAQGWISPVLLVDGRIEGTWKHERKGSQLLVTIEPFREQPPDVVRGIESEAERPAAFLGGKFELTWGKA
jgi:hypothetical protein